MEYILNFDTKKIAEINKKNLEVYKAEVERVKALDITDKEKKKLIPKKLILDAEDLLILRYIHRLVEAKEMIKLTKNSVEYTWINYKNLFEEYDGILFMEKCALNIRLNKFVDIGLIVRHTERNEMGTFSYIAQTGLVELIKIETKKIPVAVTKKNKINKKATENVEVLDGQITVDEALQEGTEVSKEELEAIKMYEVDLLSRISGIETVMSQRASKFTTNLLKKFKNQEEFIKYFDTNILPMQDQGQKNQHKDIFIQNNLKHYFNGN